MCSYVHICLMRHISLMRLSWLVGVSLWTISRFPALGLLPCRTMLFFALFFKVGSGVDLRSPRLSSTCFTEDATSPDSHLYNDAKVTGLQENAHLEFRVWSSHRLALCNAELSQCCAEWATQVPVSHVIKSTLYSVPSAEAWRLVGHCRMHILESQYFQLSVRLSGCKPVRSQGRHCESRWCW